MLPKIMKRKSEPTININTNSPIASLVNNFTANPIPHPELKAIYKRLENVIAFVNPKSGGQQGQIVYEKLKNFLPANHVFDLTKGGPKPGLDAHKNTKDLKIIACGGDGTVGWVLSVLDEINFEKRPPVAILPLGTGNDLARTLKWGSGYDSKTDLIETFLLNVVEGPIVELDRWNINAIPKIDYQSATGKNKLPLNVVNNYFSIGADAKVALDFHHAREKNPSAFSSQTANKIEYARNYSKELFDQSCKNLRDSIVVFECDGVDLLETVIERRFHSIVFLNIQSYASGSNPWKNDSQKVQSFSDGKLEVIGLKTHDLMFLKAGGHGDNIAQATKLRIVTNCEIPMQVDGEPVLMNPAEIIIERRNQALMIEPDCDGSTVASCRF